MCAADIVATPSPMRRGIRGAASEGQRSPTWTSKAWRPCSAGSSRRGPSPAEFLRSASDTSVRSGGVTAGAWAAASEKASDSGLGQRSRRPTASPQPAAPRALRPSSASSQRSSSSRYVESRATIRKGSIGVTPWQPSVGGGTHTSYSRFGRPQLETDLGSCLTRGVPSSPDVPAAFPHKAPPHEARAQIAELLEIGTEKADRRMLMLCPYMRQKGICRLPRCPYMHEACRPYKDNNPVFGVNELRACSRIPCRFLAVLGMCPFADGCAYSHGEH
mmetsp:Transcript_117849/g.251747  ORF Transcript_117849/g.251747 Transcript_117849/m.251747 type:complete len:275 (+) Transcript_117849:54-878(+)